MNRARIKAALAASTIAGGLAFALLVPGGAAVADESGGVVMDVSVGSSATLVARGAALNVTVDYLCNTQQYAYASVGVTQRVGSEIANGGASIQVTCNGMPQRAAVTIHATDGKAFRQGEAAATGYINGCGTFGCGTDTSNTTIQINR